jgi:hypothetical protein
MPTVPDIHRRGTRAAQAVIASPPLTIGTLYFVTDESVTERWNGTAWEAYSAPLGGGGAPAAHHASHETGGSDAITTLSGGVITSGTVAAARLGAHAATHNTGGSDPITALSGSVITTGTVASARLPPRVAAVGVVIDGGGSVITTGVKGFVEVPFAGTITGVTLLSTDAAVTSGSIVVDIWKDTYANYAPTVADTITASAKPTLASAIKAKDTTLTGWTTALAAGDVLGFKVDSVAALTRVALSLTVQA